jgi:hypothetical protein
MLTPVAGLLFAASVIGTGSTGAQSTARPTTVEEAKVPLSFLKTARLKSGLSFASGATRGEGGSHHGSTSGMLGGVPGVDSLINFADEFTSPGFDSVGNPQSIWPYEMVGHAPEGNRTSRINAPIIPVVLDMLDAGGNVVLSLDPTQFVHPALQSPMFEPFQYFTGYTQFNDAMMRSQFWDRISHYGDHHDGYHVLLNPRVKSVRHMRIPLGFWHAAVNPDGSPAFALVDIDAFANSLFPATSPVDDSTPIGAAELAGDMTTRDLTTLLFNNVYLYFGTTSDCCVLGFHSYDYEPGDVHNGNRERRYVMNYSSWISPNLFSGGFEDITAWSHEVAETFNDPFVDNATPWWLAEVYQGAGFGLCQNNLESGDVVEVLDSNAVFPLQLHGRTYHPSNEALFSWFAFQSPSVAKNHAYSFPDETAVLGLSPGPLGPGCVPVP